MNVILKTLTDISSRIEAETILSVMRGQAGCLGGRVGVTTAPVGSGRILTHTVTLVFKYDESLVNGLNGCRRWYLPRAAWAQYGMGVTHETV